MRERLPVSSWTAPPKLSSVKSSTLQRSCAGGSACHCDRCQRESGGSAPSSVSRAVRSTGAPLDATTRATLEPRFGADLGGVRVHTEDTSAREVDARAYTVGRDIVFGPGEYSPGSSEGQQLIAHELAHVMQQREGGGAAWPQGPLTLGATGDTHEREADSAASAVMSGGAAKVGAAPEGVVRRTPPKGANGAFSVNMTPFVTGLKGTIEFQPDPKVCPVCKSIRLTQALRVYEKPGQLYSWTGDEAGRNKSITKEDKAKGVEAGWGVDHKPKNCTEGKGCSMFYRDHWPNASSSQEGLNDGKTATKASLWDRPFGDADDVFQFETCAYCVDSKKWLGCVTWGFTADGKGAVTASAVGEALGPTSSFMGAVDTFNTFYKNK